MPKSKICLQCGFKNSDSKKHRRTPKQATLSNHKQYLNKLHKICSLAKRGQLNLALHYCYRLKTNNRSLQIKQSLLTARLWKLNNKPHKALQIMLKLQPQLPFNQKNLSYYYRMACLLQQLDQDKKAINIFKQFMEHQWEHFRDDIKQRYQHLKINKRKLALSVIEGGLLQHAHE